MIECLQKCYSEHIILCLTCYVNLTGSWLNWSSLVQMLNFFDEYKDTFKISLLSRTFYSNFGCCGWRANTGLCFYRSPTVHPDEGSFSVTSHWLKLKLTAGEEELEWESHTFSSCKTQNVVFLAAAVVDDDDDDDDGLIMCQVRHCHWTDRHGVCECVIDKHFSSYIWILPQFSSNFRLLQHFHYLGTVYFMKRAN